MRRRAEATHADAPLAFDELGGPLVVMRGLAGGAGTTTLSYLIASQAARASRAPVLLSELSDHGALAALAGTGTRLSIHELADAADAGQEIGCPFAQTAHGLRLVASVGRANEAAVPAQKLDRVLRDARAAHGLVILDAGAGPGPDDETVMRAATHVLFAMPATVPALRRAEAHADAGVFVPGSASAALVAIATGADRPVSRKQLRRFAERHVDRLLLVPHVPGLAAGDLSDADIRLQGTYGDLATVLRRPA